MDDQSEGLLTSLIGKIFRTKDEDFLEKFVLAAKADGKLRGDETRMLLNVLHLGRKDVRDIMIPRTDIVCAEMTESVEGICEQIITQGHSRIPLYKENRDNIVGIIHAKDLLGLCMRNSCDDPALARSIMRKPLFIPDTKNVIDMLQIFQSKKIHLAIALDEYGGTSGLVTFEDVLEEIVGEIEDEYDEPRPEDIQKHPDGKLFVAGRTDLDELEQHLDMHLESEQVDTLSGYLCETAGRVPEQGEVFVIQGYRFMIREANAKQIHWVAVEAVADDAS